MKHRRSIRMFGYDYSQPGYYFVTVCTNQRINILGDIINGKMMLNQVGQMINKWWTKLKDKFNNIDLDAFTVMPNHIHGIIQIVGADPCVRPMNQKYNGGKHVGLPLHRMIQWFKTMTTNEYIRNIKQYKWTPFEKRVWQRNYYEHVVRDEIDLDRIRKYIHLNPGQWERDQNNPINY